MLGTEDAVLLRPSRAGDPKVVNDVKESLESQLEAMWYQDQTLIWYIFTNSVN